VLGFIIKVISALINDLGRVCQVNNIKIISQLVVLSILVLVLLRVAHYELLYDEDRNTELSEVNLSNYTVRGKTKKFVTSGNLKITSVLLTEETPSKLTFVVTYDFYGNESKNPNLIGAFQLNVGDRNTRLGFQSIELEKGRGNRLRIKLGMIEASENKIDSDTIVFQAYSSGTAPFHQQAFAYEKHWCKRRARVWQVFSGCNN